MVSFYGWSQNSSWLWALSSHVWWDCIFVVERFLLVATQKPRSLYRTMRVKCIRSRKSYKEKQNKTTGFVFLFGFSFVIRALATMWSWDLAQCRAVIIFVLPRFLCELGIVPHCWIWYFNSYILFCHSVAIGPTQGQPSLFLMTTS